jgi:dipeptidyl-peptidase-4
MRFLEDGRRFLWATEKTGWRHFELRHLDGSLLCTLTHGAYPVTGLVRVDEERGWVYYTTRSDDHPLCTQLHRVRLNGTDALRLTPRSLNYSRFDLSPDGRWFTARFENVETPPSTALYTTAGEEVCLLAEGPAVKSRLSELFTFKADDGVTDLYGILHKPEDFDPSKKYPLVVSVYGGPGSQAVRNVFQDGTRDTRHGFLIARIDNRGTRGRGKAFMAAVYEKLGDVDIRDQADGVRHLRSRPYVDGNRVGIVGHSYGGFMAAMGILRHPDVFHAAAVCSAVTDWRNYDSIYTERYMNLPRDNPGGYDRGSAMTYVKDFKGAMLILHGMVDDNVHSNNAWQLIHALDEAKKPYESRFFPTLGHGIAGSDTRWDFFKRHLAE